MPLCAHTYTYHRHIHMCLCAHTYTYLRHIHMCLCVHIHMNIPYCTCMGSCIVTRTFQQDVLNVRLSQQVYMHNDMSCWTIVEHVYGIFTLIINSSFHKLFNCTTFHPSQASSGTKMIYTIRNISYWLKLMANPLVPRSDQ